MCVGVEDEEIVAKEGEIHDMRANTECGVR